MNDDKSPLESDLWNKILQNKVNYFMKNSPLTPIKEVVANTEKDFFEQRWISLIDIDKPHLTIDQYIELGSNYGPDLTALARSRFDTKLMRKSGTAHTPKRHSAYNNFRKAMKSKLSNEEIIKQWKEMTQEQKDKYKSPIQDKS